MRSILKTIMTAGILGLALTSGAAAQFELPRTHIAYADYFANITMNDFHRSPLVHTAPSGDLLVVMGCQAKDICLVLHPLTGISGYTHVPHKSSPTVKHDLAARADGRATLTGDDKLRVGPGRDKNWVGTVSGGARASIETCRDNFCYVLFADGRQGWVHDGALQRDRVLNAPVISGPKRMELPFGSPLRK